MGMERERETVERPVHGKFFYTYCMYRNGIGFVHSIPRTEVYNPTITDFGTARKYNIPV